MNVPLIPYGTSQTGWSSIIMILNNNNNNKKVFTKNNEVPED